MNEPAEDYWCVDVEDGGVFFVDEEQAQIVDKDLEAGVKEFVRFRDIFGSRILYRASCVNGVWDSTVPIREAGRAHRKLLDAESGGVPGLDP